jgi:hypothetical protein
MFNGKCDAGVDERHAPHRPAAYAHHCHLWHFRDARLPAPVARIRGGGESAGKPVKLIEAPNYAHLEMCESLGNPYGANGRAALEMMELN